MPLSTLALTLAAGTGVGLALARSLGPPGRIARMSGVACIAFLALGLAAAQFSAGFDGYATDLWTYALIMERVADGVPVLGLDVFWLEPPPSPQVTTLWILMGWIRGWTGMASPSLLRLLAAVAAVLMTAGTWALAGRLWDDRRARLAAVVVFWLGMTEPWAVALGRNLSLAFVFLAAAEALRGPLRPLRLGLWLGLAFHVHLFGGVLAIAAAGVSLIASRQSRDAAERWRLGGALLLALLLAAPCLWQATGFLSLPKSSAHLAPRGQLVWLGLRWLHPARVLEAIPPVLAVLAGIGLLLTTRGGPSPARRLARFGTLAAAILLFTPVYHLAVDPLGGWMVFRFAVLALPWVAATVALVHLSSGSARLRGCAYLGALALAVGASVSLAESLSDRRLGVSDLLGRQRERRRYYAFSRQAQQEAYTLRGVLKGRAYIAADSLAYALSAGTLGRPLSVPPGSASPFGDAVSRKRWVDRAMWVGSPECWSALFSLYPDLDYLVTPATGAEIETAIWRRRIPVDPHRVRESLQELGALRPAFRGSHFEVDAIADPIPGDAPVAPTVRFRKGRLCP